MIEQVRAFAEAALPGRQRVVEIAPVGGGAKKSRYRIKCASGFTCVAYVWDPDHDYFADLYVADGMSGR